MATYRVIIASTKGGVLATAAQDGWTVLNPVRSFEEIDTLDDTSLGDVGRLFTQRKGFVAFALKD